MWNYNFAIQSTFILGVILIFYFSLPRLSVRINRTFVQMLVLQSAVIFFDIVSSWADENYEIVSLAVLHVLNTVYFILFYVRTYICFVFTANVFKYDYFKSKLKTVLWNIPLILSSLLAAVSPWTGLVYSIEFDGYHSGPFYDVIYVVSYFYLAASFIVMIIFARHVKKRRYWYCMLLFNLLLLIGIVLRRAYPRMLLMDTFVLMAIIAVYLTFENPEFYLDLKGTVFNSNAFKDYIEENNGRLSHRFLAVVVHNYYDMRDIYGGKQMDVGVSLIAKYLTENFTQCNVFYYRRGRYIILGPRNLDFDACMKEVSARFLKPWTAEDLELYLDVGFVTVDMGESLQSIDGFLNTLVAAMNSADKKDYDDPVAITDVHIMENEKEMTLKRELETAIDEDKVEVFLQALVDVKTEKVVGAEALCRIRNSDGDLLPPGIFIPIAERSGRINILGEQVFEKTCRFIKEYDPKEYGIDWINVNLSPIQFMKADLAERYSSIIQKYNVDPEMIHLEITEESMVDDLFLRRQIQAMRGKGFKFVLDDYGTGYSNLSRLRNCPFINVKLDMSIVRDYCKNPDEVLPNMVQTFKHMHFEVTAEGVEDVGMAVMLKEIGCDYLQGYHYSKPIPMNEFVDKYMSE